MKAAKKVASDLAENKEMTEKQKLKVPQIHTYIHTHTHIHTYIYIHTYIHAYLYIFAHNYLDSYIHGLHSYHLYIC